MSSCCSGSRVARGGLRTRSRTRCGGAFASEVKSPNPDLSVLREFRDAVFVLQPIPLARVLSGQTEDDAYAPPAPPGGGGTAGADRGGGTNGCRVGRDRAAALRRGAHRESDRKRWSWCRSSRRRWYRSRRRRDAATAADNCQRGRAVHFCPHCGQSQLLGQCPKCKAEVEYGWRHCVGCGTGLSFDA